MPGNVTRMATYYQEKLAMLLKNIDQESLPQINLRNTKEPKKKIIQGQKKTYLAPPPNVSRTAMGEFIVPPGGKPLTHLHYARPGPSSYKTPNIDITHRSAPHYSIPGLGMKVRAAKIPGPGTYDVVGNLNWKHRSLTFSRRLKDIEKLSASDKASPASYVPTELNTGDCGPKYSLAGRVVDCGLHSSIAPPSRPHGFQTPGPDFWPNTDYLGGGVPAHQFAKSEKDEPKPDFPGPADYPIPAPDKGPAYTIRKKPDFLEKLLRRRLRREPGPASYHIESNMGKGCAVSLKGHPLKPLKCVGASPASFFVKRNMKPNGAFMTYRASELVDETPGPANYDREPKQVKEDKRTTFICRHNCCPTFPDMGSDIRKFKVNVAPGPANYNLSKDYKKNDKPAYTMGSKTIKDMSDSGPGPSDYDTHKYNVLGNKSTPAYTMREKLTVLDKTKIPSPADYCPKLPKSAPRYTIASKCEPKPPAWTSPAPNAYDQSANKTAKRKLPVTLKGRTTPWIYFGFPSRIG